MVSKSILYFHFFVFRVFRGNALYFGEIELLAGEDLYLQLQRRKTLLLLRIRPADQSEKGVRKDCAAAN